jgi:transposase
MARFVVGDDRSQSTLFPERLDDYLGEDNPVRAIDVFVDELDLGKLGFGGVEPEATGRPAYHPATLLKIYVYGYLNRVQSSRRLERECQRNIELVWLTGRLMPDFKTIADFRKDNGDAIRKVCREFVILCRRLELFSAASVAIDGSKFKAVNTRDRNFTQAKMERRLAQIDESIARYLAQLDSADRQGEAVPEAKITRLNDRGTTPRDRTPEPAKLSDDGNRRQTDLADRSRCALDGNEWPRQRNGRLQCAECRRYQPSSHCRP